MTKKKRHSLLIALLMLVLGLALSAFGRSLLAGKDSSGERIAHYQETLLEYEALEAQNQRLTEQNEQLEAKKDVLIASLEGHEDLDQLLKEREAYAVAAGLTAVEGPGIRIVLQDRIEYDPTRHPIEAIVHDKTVLHVIDILKANGAQALAFNDMRLTAVAKIGCIGPTILCYDMRQMPPYVIEAIGPIEDMANAIAADAYLKHITSPEIGIRMNVAVEDNLELPSFSRTGDYRSQINLLELR